jgi:glutathione S-transferase
MITLYGEGRGFRIAWLLEEMGLPYRLRPVDMLAGVENDPEFLTINPAGFIPAIKDGDIVMVESIAIMQYLLARYGPSPLVPQPDDTNFTIYLQFLHLAEAGVATPVNISFLGRILKADVPQPDWTAREASAMFERRRLLIERQLERALYIAGDQFTAADIAMTFALELAFWTKSARPTDTEEAYIKRTSSRDAYQRAMNVCKERAAWRSRVTAK